MKQELKIYKALSVSEINQKNAMYCIKGSSDSQFTIVITDSSGIPVYQKQGAGGVNSVTGTAVTGTTTNPIIDIATFLSSEIGNLLSISTQDNKLFVEPIISPDSSIEISGTQLQLATALQNLINSAVQPEDLADVATSGDYNDLINKPENAFKSVFRMVESESDSPLQIGGSFEYKLTDTSLPRTLDKSYTPTWDTGNLKGQKATIEVFDVVPPTVPGDNNNHVALQEIGFDDTFYFAGLSDKAGRIYYSTDYGKNIFQIGNLKNQFSYTSCIIWAMKEMANGEMVVNMASLEPNNEWHSYLYYSTNNKTTWTRSAKFGTSDRAEFTYYKEVDGLGATTFEMFGRVINGWGFSTYENFVMACEYGYAPNGGVSTNPNRDSVGHDITGKILLSDDYGVTFKEVFDYINPPTSINFVTFPGMHHGHGGFIDPFYITDGIPRLVGIFGDAESRLVFSDDGGVTWIDGRNVIDRCGQAVSGFAVSGGYITTPDSQVNTIQFIHRATEPSEMGADNVFEMMRQEDKDNIALQNRIVYVGGNVSQRTAKAPIVTLFTPEDITAFNAGARGGVAISYDEGRTWNEIWRDTDLEVFQGIQNAVIFETRDGTLWLSPASNFPINLGEPLDPMGKIIKLYLGKENDFRVDSDFLHRVGDETKTGRLTASGYTSKVDSTGSVPSQLILAGGGVNEAKNLFAGVDVSTNHAIIQTLWQLVGVMPLELNPLGGQVLIGTNTITDPTVSLDVNGKVKVTSGTLTNHAVNLGQLNTKFDTPTGNNTQYLDGAGTPTTFPTIPSGVTNLTYTPSSINGIVVSDTGTDATITSVDYTNAGLQTPKEKQLEYNNASTGLISFSGLSINVDTTKFNVGAIKGWFVDNTTTPETPTKIYVDFPQSLANTVTNIATQNVTYIAIDSLGVLHQSGMPFEPEQQRDWIPLGVIVHSNRTTINAVNNQPVIALSPNNQLSDLMESIGFFNISGNVFSPNGANLSINKSAGHIFKQGSNFVNNNKDPHTLPLSALIAPNNIRYRLQNGTESADTNVVAPNFWDDGGVLTAMTGTRWSIQRIYVFQSNLVRIQYGQATYATRADAIEAIPTEPFVVEQNILENGLFRGLLIVRRNTTDLTDTTRALFIEAGKFGSVTGLGSLSTSSLQQAYNNSITPEIVTDSTLGAVTIKRGSALDTDTVFETQNGAGVVTASIDGNGQILGSNLSGINTGDETTLSIQTKRPLKTINGNSLEGVGNLTIITPTLIETEIDFGTKPLNNKTFTITDGSVINTNKIMVIPSPNNATGQVGNDWEMDSATFSAKANTGNITLYVNTPFSMNGKRKIYYQILN